MNRIFCMVACLAGAGANAWFLMPNHHGSIVNAVSLLISLGAAAYVMASLIRWPDE